MWELILSPSMPGCDLNRKQELYIPRQQNFLGFLIHNKRAFIYTSIGDFHDQEKTRPSVLKPGTTQSGEA